MSRQWWTWFGPVALVAVAGFACSRIAYHLQQSWSHPEITFEEKQLDQADRLARLGNWEAAHPIYSNLERRFEALGDKRNTLYAHISRLHAEEEYSNLQQLSAYLATQLERPDVQSDSRLKLRCLEVKGNVDLNLDGLSARPSFQEMEKLAIQLGDKDLASRASGELGILAFLEGNTAEARWRIGAAIANAFLRGDAGAKIRYLSLMGQGLAEHHYSEHALWCLDRAINIANQVPECGFPKIASIGKATALIQLNRFDEARTVIEQGLAYARKNGFLGYQVDMLAQSAQLAVKEKDIHEAIRRYELAADLATRIHFNRGLAEVNSQLAALHQQMGNLRKAEECAAKSVGAHRELGEVYVIPHHLAVKAAIEAQAGDTAEADRSFQSAEQVVRTMLINAPTLLAKKAVIAAMSEVFVAHFEVAANILHDIPKAYAIIEEARGRVEADRLRSQTTQPVSRTRAQLDAEKRVAILQSRLLDTQNPAERERLSDALLDMESALAPVYPTKLPTPEPGHPMPLHEVQGTLAPDELLLEHVLGEKRSYCISVTRDHTRVTALADRASLDKLVQKYLQEIKA